MPKYSFSEKQDKRREERRPKPYINPFSKKRSKMSKEYQVVRIEYLLDNPMCEARVNCLGNKSTQIHHLEGKIGDLLTDKENFLATCAMCHQWLERNPVMAKDLGFSRNRLSK